MVLLDSRLILKTVISPEDESTLLYKRYVIYFMRTGDGKSSNTYW